jgi:glyoxylase-like metal-dependent hydrolase (beta-lactamase superfamily II)
MSSPWREVGDRVFVRRYAVFDQNIVVVLDRGEALVVDTRSTLPQGLEILTDLRELGSPRVAVVVNTHGHFDHAFGNVAFRPAVVWGHERCVPMLVGERAARQRVHAAEMLPDLAADLASVELDPPTRVFATSASVTVGGREVRLDYLGRGHTDNDIVVRVPDADVICAGDLLENGATPYFGDGYPLDWPATATALAELAGPATVVVPGHGDHAGLEFVVSQAAGFWALAELARRVHAGDLPLADAIALAPYPVADAVEPLERALRQLRGELNEGVARDG